MIRTGSLLCVAALLCACAADPTHFYTLQRPQTQALTPQSPAYVLDLQPVRIPAQLDQPELVVRQGQGEVALVETRRWIAPLGEEVRGALLARLRQQLGAAEVSQLSPPPDARVYRVLLDLQRLDAQLARGVSLDAGWSVLDVSSGSASRQRWTCTSSVSVPVSAGYENLVMGMQQALDRVADQVAALISAAQSGGRVSCPPASVS